MIKDTQKPQTPATLNIEEYLHMETSYMRTSVNASRLYCDTEKDMGDLMNGCTGRTITIKIILIAFYRFHHQLSMDIVFYLLNILSCTAVLIRIVRVKGRINIVLLTCETSAALLNNYRVYISFTKKFLLSYTHIIIIYINRLYHVRISSFSHTHT